MTLEEAVEMVNSYNRDGANPIVLIVQCDYCGGEFARSVNLYQREGARIVCPKEECQQEAKDERWKVSLGEAKSPLPRPEPTRNRLKARIAKLQKEIAAKSKALYRVKAQLAAWQQQQETER